MVEFWSKELEEAFSGISECFQKIQEDVSGLAVELSESLREINRRLPDDIKVLADRGWFISQWHTPLVGLGRVVDQFEIGDCEGAHDALCQHFEDILNDIESELIEEFPRRRAILAKAFEAHKRGDFELSIPVFLSQADGIAAECFGVSIYTRDSRKRSEIEKFIDGLAPGELHDEMLRLSLRDLPLTESTKSENYTSSTFSRHGVLHGIDVDYPSKLNSLRSISWLQYTAFFKEAIRWAGRNRK